MNQFVKDLEKNDIISYLILKHINDLELKHNLLILMKFNHEMFNIPHVLNNSMLGFLRTTWWKEFITMPQNIQINNDLASPFLIHKFLQANKYNDELVKSLIKIINSIEMIFAMAEIKDLNLFKQQYVKPLSQAYKSLYFFFANEEKSDEITVLLESYVIAKFFNNYENLLNHGWAGLSLSKADIRDYLNLNMQKLKIISRYTLKNKCFKILYVGTNFLLHYYINNLPVEKNNYYTPNYGLLRLKLACNLIF